MGSWKQTFLVLEYKTFLIDGPPTNIKKDVGSE